MIWGSSWDSQGQSSCLCNKEQHALGRVQPAGPGRWSFPSVPEFGDGIWNRSSSFVPPRSRKALTYQREPNGGAAGSRAGAHEAHGEDERAGFVQPEQGSGEIFLMSTTSCMKPDSDSSQRCGLEVEPMALAGTQDTPVSYKETRFYDEGGWTLK